MDFVKRWKKWILSIVMVVTCHGCLLAEKGPYVADLDQLLGEPTLEEWQALTKFNLILTRQQFHTRLNDLFDPFNGLDPFLEISKTSVRVYSKTKGHDLLPPLVEILFAEGDPAPLPAMAPPPATAPPSFRVPAEIRSLAKSPGKPLSGLRVAIDPADIGGEWADEEDRSTYYPGFGRIREGSLNLTVAKVLQQRLSDLGAEVFLVRETTEPVSGLQPENVIPRVRDILAKQSYLLPTAYTQRSGWLSRHEKEVPKIAAQLLLTKTIETRARAEKVRQNFRPDLTLVIQHNATSASSYGELARINRNVFFIHGAYTAREISRDPHQRLRLLTKLFENATPVETEVAVKISDAFKKATGYPPVLYGDSSTTRSVPGGNEYIVARNLAFNREHDGPVVVTEPYFMNNPATLRRLLAGDFEGSKILKDKPSTSIYQEYADAVTQGILAAYSPPPLVHSFSSTPPSTSNPPPPSAR